MAALVGGAWWMWFYQPSFPLGVHFELEVDDKPVVLHQLVDCIRTQTYAGGIGHKAQHKFLPFPRSIGKELPDGSSVLAIVPPGICAMWQNWPEHNRDRRGLLPFQPVPEFVAMLAWAEAGMPPPRIDMYLSREAVTRPGAKVRYKSLRVFHSHDEKAERDIRFEWFSDLGSTRLSKPSLGRRWSIASYEGYWALELNYGSDIESIVENGGPPEPHLASEAAREALHARLQQLDIAAKAVSPGGTQLVYTTRKGSVVPGSLTEEGREGVSTASPLSQILQAERLPGEDDVYALRPEMTGVLSLYQTEKPVRYVPPPQHKKFKIMEQRLPADQTGRTIAIFPNTNTYLTIRYQSMQIYY